MGSRSNHPANGGMLMRHLLKILLFAAFCAAALFPALFIESVDGFLPSAVLASVLFCGFFCGAVGMARLRGSVKLRGTAFVRGTAGQAVCTVQNRSVFPLPRVTATFAVVQPDGNTKRTALVFALAPGQTEHLTLSVPFPHVGHCCVRLEKLTVQDLTGLFTLWKKGSVSPDIPVAPYLRAWDSLPVHGREREEYGGAETNAPRALEGNYTGVRTYENGDPLHGIHWKLTAHTGAFMSRVYEQSARETLCIAADLTRQADTAAEFDLLVEEPLNAALAALQEGLRVTIRYTGTSGLCSFSPEGGRDILALGELWATLRGQVSPDARADLLASLFRGQTGVFLCTASFSPALVQSLLGLRRNGANAALLWVTDSAPADVSARFDPLFSAGVDCSAKTPADAGPPKNTGRADAV